jgi:hypothetical protein
MLEIQLTTDRRAPLEPALAQAAEVEARNAAGEAVVSKLQDHFLVKNAQPNAKNWPKRGFWAEVLRSIGSNITATAYEIAVASPAFWRRWKGGPPITHKAAKRLAIPAIADAYAAGRPAAGRIPVDLMVIVRKRQGKTTVALAEFSTRPNKRDPNRQIRVPGRIWYWLVQQANPGPDPTAVPPIAELNAAATQTADAYLASLRARLALFVAVAGIFAGAFPVSLP